MLVFDLHQKSLLADRGNISREFQAAVPAVTNRSGREEALEELVWRPDSGLEEDQVDQFIISRVKHKFDKVLLVTEHHLGIRTGFQSPAMNLCTPDHPQGLPGGQGAPPRPRPWPHPAPRWRANMLDIQEDDMKKACTDLMVTFIDIKYGASAKEFLSMVSRITCIVWDGRSPSVMTWMMASFDTRIFHSVSPSTLVQQ